MIIHLIDGTYELFRHFYGLRRFQRRKPPKSPLRYRWIDLPQMPEMFLKHL
jgi:hypothetical protein